MPVIQKDRSGLVAWVGVVLFAIAYLLLFLWCLGMVRP